MATINHWSDYELDILHRHYPTATQREMASMLPARGYGAIKQKAKALNIRKRIKDDTILKLDKNSRVIHSGVILQLGNIMTHRMM